MPKISKMLTVVIFILINQYQIQDIPTIMGINQILFLIPYSKNFSRNAIKNIIAKRIINDKKDLGMNKTWYRNITPSPISFE
jgi:hypothetical protein